MRHFTKNTKVIAKVSLVLILLSFLGLKSKAAEADNNFIEDKTQKVEIVKVK